MQKNKIRFLSLALITALFFIGGTNLSVAVPAESFSKKQALDKQLPEVTRVSLILAHPISLDNAIDLNTQEELGAIAYGFSNGPVVGEYSLDSMIAPEDFQNIFYDRYETELAINALVVLRGTKEQIPRKIQTDLGVDIPELPVSQIPAQSFSPTENGETNDGIKSNSFDGITPNYYGDWRPDDSAHYIYPMLSSAGYFWQKYVWKNHGLYSLPSEVGLEFEINEWNE